MIQDNFDTDPLDFSGEDEEPATLLDGLQTILNYAEGSALSQKFFRKVQTPMEYLCRRMELTPTQVSLLAIILEHGYQRRVNLTGISRFLGTSLLDILSKNDDLAALQERRLIVKVKDGYTVTQEVYNAFQHDEVYAYKPPVLNSDEELAEHLDSMFSNFDNKELGKDTELFDHDVHELLTTNKHLRLARILLGVMKKTSEKEFRVVLLMSMWWIRDNEVSIDGSRFSVVLPRPFEVRQMINALQKGKSILIKKNIVIIADADGLLVSDAFSLSDKFRKELTPDRFVGQDKTEKSWSNRLTKHKDIQPKEMFYNPEAVGEVSRLTQLLQPKHMNGVLARLKERGLRGGFTCLLYGAPGTGKTETVLQLARSCGRDIYQVDVSQLRTKWYGESEKQVKGVFDEYRHIVEHSKTAPIMFFNEADAIFNRRMENAERSVDKSENALQNIILQEMESLNGILIATTNLQGNLDEAFERRFLYKLRLDKPTAEVKAHIWQNMMPDLTDEESRWLADEFDFSGGQIENVVRKRFIDEVLTGSKTTIADLQLLCRSELLENNHQKSIGFLRHSHSHLS